MLSNLRLTLLYFISYPSFLLFSYISSLILHFNSLSLISLSLFITYSSHPFSFLSPFLPTLSFFITFSSHSFPFHQLFFPLFHFSSPLLSTLSLFSFSLPSLTSVRAASRFEWCIPWHIFPSIFSPIHAPFLCIIPRILCLYHPTYLVFVSSIVSCVCIIPRIMCFCHPSYLVFLSPLVSCFSIIPRILCLYHPTYLVFLSSLVSCVCIISRILCFYHPSYHVFLSSLVSCVCFIPRILCFYHPSCLVFVSSLGSCVCVIPHILCLYTCFFGEMKNNTVMSIYSYLFPNFLLRKTIFSYSSMLGNLYYDSLKGFRRCIVDTKRRYMFHYKGVFRSPSHNTTRESLPSQENRKKLMQIFPTRMCNVTA